MRKIDKEMPYASQRLLELIDIQADGRVQKFAKMIGLSQQRINRLFVRDNRNNQFPRMTDEIKNVVIEHFGLPQNYFVTPATEEEVNPYNQLFGSDNIIGMESSGVSPAMADGIEKLTKEELVFLVKQLISLHSEQTDMYRMLIRQNEVMIRNGQERLNNISNLIFKNV